MIEKLQLTDNIILYHFSLKSLSKVKSYYLIVLKRTSAKHVRTSLAAHSSRNGLRMWRPPTNSVAEDEAAEVDSEAK